MLQLSEGFHFFYAKWKNIRPLCKMGSIRENSIKLAGDNVGFHVGSSDAVFVSDFGPRLEVKHHLCCGSSLAPSDNLVIGER